MAKRALFIEGSSNTSNGNLRIGFNKLLRNAGKGMPEIKMSDDLASTIRKFKQEVENPASEYQQVLLLVDLDGPEDIREAWLARYELVHYREQVFCMIQEMEAWFLSQPDKLHTYYGAALPHTLPKTAPTHTSNPAQKLAHCTKDYKPKGTYHKVKHGTDLLGMLDLLKLQADFPDVARLVAML